MKSALQQEKVVIKVAIFGYSDAYIEEQHRFTSLAD
jgi:hypothetical protein